MHTKQLVPLWTFLLAGLLNLPVSAADDSLTKLAAANNTFALKLIKELTRVNQSSNLFVSPYSAATALQMVANGAGGQTKAEMESALATTGIPPEAINAASKAALERLNSADTNIILTTANALWYRAGSDIKPEFLAVNQKFFRSTIKTLDFSNAPAAEAVINQWVSDQTRGRITRIADGMVDPKYTDLMLANAIYFKGKWLDPFDKDKTKPRLFHATGGPARQVPMMQMSKEFSYRKGSGYRAVRLPYMGDELGMYVFLPDPGSSPAKLLHIMNGDNWRRVTMPGFAKRDGLVVLPKFRLENTFDLAPSLQALGMKAAFNSSSSPPQADFSGMFKTPHHISGVRQKAFVEVGEEGTEAAAVTMIGVFPTGIDMTPRPKPFELIVDRPFLFAIVDSRSGMILFMGVVNSL